MSLFRKPKKPMQRRVFSAQDDEDAVAAAGDEFEKMDVDETPPSGSSSSHRNDRKDRAKEKKPKSSSTEEGKQSKTKSLLSFADDDEEDEIFQVKKSSHSKKVMRMMDKERRKKAKGDKTDKTQDYDNSRNAQSENGRSSNSTHSNSSSGVRTTSDSKSKYDGKKSSTSSVTATTANSSSKTKKSDSIQTEIHTDDFVLVVKKSEPDNIILNGRAAVCAGRDDMSDEDPSNVDENEPGGHRFSKPEQLKQFLESGSIPDAAMIHAARKRRQKAREQGDFIPIEEQNKEPPKKGNRLVREDPECDGSDEEERVDMNAITGVKEREERREQFYSVENDYSEDDSDREMNEWENQQIRKGVTGAQLVTAQQESVLSRFIIKSSCNQLEDATHLSTSTLLEQAYAKSSLEKPRQIILSTQKSENKASSLRTPDEIRNSITTRLSKLQEINDKHVSDIERIATELQTLKLEELDCTQKAPTAAAKYRFYQEIRGYITDLIDCLDEKAPLIADLEKRVIGVYSKHANYLIERRRQDVRDQAKEMAEASKPNINSKRGAEYEEQTRRAAEREGRRTRRRCDREKNDMLSSHLDGMSSDDEVADQDIVQYKANLDQIEVESDDLFADTCDDFCKVNKILNKFDVWRKTDMESYRDAFVSLCIPKILGLIIRVQMLMWNPLTSNFQDIEKFDWFSPCMLYGWVESETEEALAIDPDVKLVPTVVERIILPKLTEIIENCWDPLSTRETLRLIGVINRLGRDYPLREVSKPLQGLFNSILDKMKTALENDVFIPIFPKQMQEAKTSFFQRQFCSGLKLFRNLLSWQGIIADKSLRELAISSLLNRYLLSAMRVCTPNDALSKAYVVVNTLPTAWLHPNSDAVQNLQLFITFIKSVLENYDKKNPLHIGSCEKAKQILQRLHSS